MKVLLIGIEIKCAKKNIIEGFFTLLLKIKLWILYEIIHGMELTQNDFRGELAEVLCRSVNKSVKRGRSTRIKLKEELTKKKKVPTNRVPIKEERLDGINHWPIYQDF